MCITFFYVNDTKQTSDDDILYIFTANRDEYFDREAVPAYAWPESNIFAPRDLSAHGTWLGFTAVQGDQKKIPEFKIGVLTNKNPNVTAEEIQQRGTVHQPKLKTRGKLVSGFFEDGCTDVEEYFGEVGLEHRPFGGYNLILGISQRLYYFHDFSKKMEVIEPGFHGLSNAKLDTPWCKIVEGKERFKAVVDDFRLNSKQDKQAEIKLLDRLLEMMTSVRVYSKQEETMYRPGHQNLTSVFVPECTLEREGVKGIYGTRYQSAFIVKRSGVIHIKERNLNMKTKRWETRQHTVYARVALSSQL